MQKVVQQQNVRIAELEKKVGERSLEEGTQDALTQRSEERIESHLRQNLTEYEISKGLLIGGGATGVYQFTGNANGDDLSQNSEDLGDASYSLDVELSKEFGENGQAFILFEAGEGAGVEDELKVFSNVNFDATGGDAANGDKMVVVGGVRSQIDF